MDEINNQEDPVEDEIEEEELGVTDKMVGVLTEPSATFSNIAKHNLKTIDWALPIFLTAVIAVIGFKIMMSNGAVSMNFDDKQSSKIEEQMQKRIDSGQMTQEQADMGKEMGLKWAKIGFYIAKFFMPWILLFIAALIYWLVSKFGFKDASTYKGTLVALGLSSYILILQTIVTIIFAYALGIFLNSPNLGEILGMDITKFPEILLSFVEVFMIWYTIVISIGMSKIFHATSNTKYYILTFGLWIGLSLFFFAIS